jgi:hypothetical protein
MVKAPPPMRCPRCWHLPASATLICLVCRHDAREPAPRPQCPYTRLPCNCGLRGYCMAEVA